jgi:hypothetical protein
LFNPDAKRVRPIAGATPRYFRRSGGQTPSAACRLTNAIGDFSPVPRIFSRDDTQSEQMAISVAQIAIAG